MSAQIFGQKVSIITKSEIRYEGVIFQINQQEQKLTLKDVRSFGTEGRRPGEEIAAVMNSYPLICFRAHEIKELKIIQQAEPKVEQDQQIYIPAQPQQPAKPEPKQQEQQEYQQPQQPSLTQQLPLQSAIQKNSNMFDFDNMLGQITELERIKLEAHNQQPKYQKTNFFDEISSTVSSKQLGPRTMTRDERKHQNEQDTETFGQFYKHGNQPYNKHTLGKQTNNQRRNNRGNGGNSGAFNYDNSRKQYNNSSNYNNSNNNSNNNNNYNHNSSNNNWKRQDRVFYVEKQVEKKEL